MTPPGPVEPPCFGPYGTTHRFSPSPTSKPHPTPTPCQPPALSRRRSVGVFWCHQRGEGAAPRHGGAPRPNSPPPAAPAGRGRSRPGPRAPSGRSRRRRPALGSPDELSCRRGTRSTTAGAGGAQRPSAASQGGLPGGKREHLSGSGEAPRPAARRAPLSPTTAATPRPGYRALTAEEGAEDEAFLLVPLEETPEGPEHPARPARPGRPSPPRVGGRGGSSDPARRARPPGPPETPPALRRCRPWRRRRRRRRW